MPIWYQAAGFAANSLLSVLPWFGGKFGKWQRGQGEAWQKLAAFKQSNKERPFWFHCASLGEFEQAKPVLLAMRERHPGVPVVVTFFSPSGYEARKNYPSADLICYLPLDGGDVPRHWVEALQPRAVFWVKYEFWLGYLKAVKKAGIPLYLLAALPKAHYFQGIRAGYYKQAFGYFDKLFLQYPESFDLLPTSLKDRGVMTGDPRYDNVLAGIKKALPIPELTAFKEANNRPVLLVGSAWQADMEVLLPAIQNLKYRLVIFPHEMQAGFLSYLKENAPGRVSLWSEGVDPKADTLIVDQVGFLSSAYAYADVAWVGGGFGTGLHNILEAAAWGKPVLYGPQTAHFPEAARLAGTGGGFSVSDAPAANTALQKLQDLEIRDLSGTAARLFVEAHAGATQRILAEVDPPLSTFHSQL